MYPFAGSNYPASIAPQTISSFKHWIMSIQPDWGNGSISPKQEQPKKTYDGLAYHKGAIRSWVENINVEPLKRLRYMLDLPLTCFFSKRVEYKDWHLGIGKVSRRDDGKPFSKTNIRGIVRFQLSSFCSYLLLEHKATIQISAHLIPN